MKIKDAIIKAREQKRMIKNDFLRRDGSRSF